VAPPRNDWRAAQFNLPGRHQSARCPGRWYETCTLLGMQAPDKEPKTVLIADDDDWLREMLGVLLAGEGLHLLEAATGTDAVRVACERHPNAILLDIGMPGLSGLEVLEALRKRDSTRDIPVLLVSGEINLVDTGHAYDADAALHKPLDFGMFLAKVRELTDS
jgi:two-component system, OmpR family, KDP operon response regulator KdpE